jgi:hypothetical protein
VRGFLYVVAKDDVLRVYAINPSGGLVDTFRIRP